MASESINQQMFEEDVLAAEAAAAGAEGLSGFGDPNANFKMPSIEEVWKLIEQMDGISDEEKADLKKNLYNPQEGSAEDFMKRYAQPIVQHSRFDYLIFFIMIALIVLIFVLFGYKLYKSLMEKELRRQEKQKSKQAKKVKKSN